MLNLLIVNIILLQLSLTALGVTIVMFRRGNKELKLEEEKKKLERLLEKEKQTDGNFYG